MDVAISLMRRNDFCKAHSVKRLRLLGGLYSMKRKIGNFTYSQRCLSVDGAMSLWLQYCRQARVNIGGDHGRALCVRYEDLLEDPGSVISRICEFAGVAPGQERLARATALVKKDGAFRYRNSEHYRQLALRWAENLEEMGYRP